MDHFFRSRTLACFIGWMAGSFSAACTATSPSAGDEHAGSASVPILGGEADTTHAAVVAVLGRDFSCSGTILQIKDDVAYVLTAAHCCTASDPATHVVVGQGFGISEGDTFEVARGSVRGDSCYLACPGSTDDVCMLRFAGVSRAGLKVTPIAPMTPQSDQLAVGTPLTYVGYGLVSAPPGGANTQRRSVQKRVGQLDAYFVDYDNPGASGTCEGDSGGPAIALADGAEQVAAVISFGEKSCTGLGSSIRTSAVYATFIQPYLADQAVPAAACPVTTDCGVCAQNAESAACGGSCAAVAMDCFNDAACKNLGNCLSRCSTTTCTMDCTTQNVAGLQKYQAVAACLCAGSCATVCAKDPLCATPQCGSRRANSTAACDACAENECCAETWSCSVDPACKRCLTAATPDPSCATNSRMSAFNACISSRCAACSTGGQGDGGTGISSSFSSTISSLSSSASSSDLPSSGSSSSNGGDVKGPSSSLGGCSCSTDGSNRPRDGLFSLVVGAAVALRRRRRKP